MRRVPYRLDAAQPDRAGAGGPETPPAPTTPTPEYDMNTAPHAVRHQVVLDLLGPQGSNLTEAELRYDPVDPYAVSVAFAVAGRQVVWVFARDLLIRGVHEPVGEGDVQVFPSLDQEGHAVVLLALHAPAGEALVEARSRDVLDFLAHTTRSVWPGTESQLVSTDAAIAAILVND